MCRVPDRTRESFPRESERNRGGRDREIPGLLETEDEAAHGRRGAPRGSSGRLK